MKTVVVVDSNNFSFAQYHTHKELRTSFGQGTGLIHGSLEGLIKLASVFPGSPIIMAWDGGGLNWRKAEAPMRYKANRDHNTDARRDCMSQIDIFCQFLKMLQIPSLRVYGVEGDDLIGILVHELKKDFDRVVIRSSDKDFYQLLDKQVKILRGQVKWSKPLNKNTVDSFLITERNIPQGLSPKRWTTFRALCGDSSDNMKGLVSGCGEVAAATLVASGIKLPTYNSPAVKKISRLSSKEITKADWERVNENFRLSNIIIDYKDKRIPREGGNEIKGFLYEWRKKGFKRNVKAIDEWSLMKSLGSYELQHLAAQVQSLVKIF